MAQTEGRRATLQRQELVWRRLQERRIYVSCWHASYVSLVRLPRQYRESSYTLGCGIWKYESSYTPGCTVCCENMRVVTMFANTCIVLLQKKHCFLSVRSETVCNNFIWKLPLQKKIQLKPNCVEAFLDMRVCWANNMTPTYTYDNMGILTVSWKQRVNNNNNMSKQQQQQQQHNTTTTTTTATTTAATHVLIILFLSLSTQQVWNATTECDERMQWWDATEDMSVSSRHCSRRMQKILLAVRRDTQEIQARLTYLSACLNRCYKLGKLLEQMLQVRRHSLQTTLPCVELSSILLAVRRDTQEIQARLTYLSACLNRCYKLGKLLEQMLQVRRHSLQTTLPCVELSSILLAVRRDTQEIQARLTYLSACLNRCYKLGKLLEQMLQVRRHSLQTTLPCVELSSERPKVLRRRQFWIIFTCTCDCL